MVVIRVCTSVLLVSLALCNAYSTNYHGYQQWQVNNIDENQIDDIRGIIKSFHLEVLSSGRTSMDIMVEPSMQKMLGRTLASKGLQYDIIVQDMQSLIDEELQRLQKDKSSVGIDITDFNDFATIVTYMTELADEYDWVSIESIGQTVEGQELWVNTLAVPGAEPKPSIWIDCGIHAREWLSHATCVYGLDYLTKGYSTVEEVTNLLDKYDLYIMPVYNPDGYVYSWTEDRYWRKNRIETEDPNCPGVDLNRNSDDGHWDGPYSDDFPCGALYRGSAPFSELETQAVRDHIESLSSKPTAYFNIHTYGQYWMHAIGFTSDLPAEYDEIHRVVETGVDALEAVHGTSYNYGPAYTTLYPVNGDALDWAYVNGIIYAFVMELRGPSFVCPATEIVPTGEETWAGIMAAVMAI